MASGIFNLKYGDQGFVHTWVEENNGLKTIYGYEILNGKDELQCK